MSRRAAATVVVDGGDRACGELLLVLAGRIRSLAPGTAVRLIATDPAAGLDLPAWCHLTGHTYVGTSRSAGRPCYDVLTTHRPRATDGDRPWHLTDSASSSAPSTSTGETP